MRPPDGIVFSILGDDDCRAILDRLVASGKPLTQRELAADLNFKSSRISRRMKEIEEGGLVARASPHAPYTLLFRERIGDLLVLGGDLASEIAMRSAEEAASHAGRRRESRVDIDELINGAGEAR